MTAEGIACIYCKCAVEPGGDGDHVIPAVLGEFKGDFHFRRICRACNTAIGSCEQQLVRCGPERLFRDIVIPCSSRNRQGRKGWAGAGGMPPPKVKVMLDDGPLLAKSGVDPRNIDEREDIFEQLVLKGEDGKDHFIILDIHMTVVSLRRAIESIKPANDEGAKLRSRPENRALYKGLLEQIWPGGQWAEGRLMEAGNHEVCSHVEMRVTSDYFRAIAKIVFHYYLTQSIRAKGDEPGFERIRQFIRHGGRQEAFFLEKPVFFDGIPDCLTPSWWHHLLGATDAGGRVIASVRLFWGPESGTASKAYDVRLGTLSPLVLSDQHVAWAHEYAYDNPVPETGKVGVVNRVPLKRIPTAT